MLYRWYFPVLRAAYPSSCLFSPPTNMLLGKDIYHPCSSADNSCPKVGDSDLPVFRSLSCSIWRGFQLVCQPPLRGESDIGLNFTFQQAGAEWLKQAFSEFDFPLKCWARLWSHPLISLARIHVWRPWPSLYAIVPYFARAVTAMGNHPILTNVPLLITISVPYEICWNFRNFIGISLSYCFITLL